jgi:hypothetical protein
MPATVLGRTGTGHVEHIYVFCCDGVKCVRAARDVVARHPDLSPSLLIQHPGSLPDAQLASDERSPASCETGVAWCSGLGRRREHDRGARDRRERDGRAPTPDGAQERTAIAAVAGSVVGLGSYYERTNLDELHTEGGEEGCCRNQARGIKHGLDDYGDEQIGDTARCPGTASVTTGGRRCRSGSSGHGLRHTDRGEYHQVGDTSTILTKADVLAIS